MGASDHVQYFVEGINDALQWRQVYRVIKTFKQVQRTLLKSIALNGIIFLGIIGFMELFYVDRHFYGHSYTALTGYPLYMVCLLFNSRFYSKIAQTEHYNNLEGNKLNVIVLYGNMALFSVLLRRIPMIGFAVAFFVDCITMAYYCFEYKWMREEWPIKKRLTYAEEHWSYYLGFGLPGTLFTFYLSTLKAGAVFALIYPSFIIMASTARPKPIQYIHTDRIPVFFGVRVMNQFVSVFRSKTKYRSLKL